jgi:hypothetical protein
MQNQRNMVMEGLCSSGNKTSNRSLPNREKVVGQGMLDLIADLKASMITHRALWMIQGR